MTALLRPLRATLILSGLVTLFLCQRHSGFMLILVAVPLVPWAVYSTWIIATRPPDRKLQITKLGIWVASVATIVLVHAYLFVTTRDQAQDVANTIDRYIATHGTCPSSLETIGLNKKEFRAKFGYSAYFCEAGKPTLFYATTYVPFEQENYDFVTHRWVHIND